MGKSKRKWKQRTEQLRELIKLEVQRRQQVEWQLEEALAYKNSVERTKRRNSIGVYNDEEYLTKARLERGVAHNKGSS